MCIAGWSSLVARRAHNPKVVGSNPTPATGDKEDRSRQNDRSSAFLADFGQNRASSAYPASYINEDLTNREIKGGLGLIPNHINRITFKGHPYCSPVGRKP